MATTKIRGTALAPGISRNGRLYTREAIAKMVTRAQARIASGGVPLTMATHHEGATDSTRIVGTVTKMQVAPDGSAAFEADLATTKHARTISKLVEGGHLRFVSIRGEWVGGTRQAQGQDGRPLETGDDLELHGVDFTPRPGVAAATIVGESAPNGRMILEEAPAPELVPAGPDTAALAGMCSDDFTAAAGAYFGTRLAALDDGKPAKSPFWRGMPGGTD